MENPLISLAREVYSEDGFTDASIARILREVRSNKSLSSLALDWVAHELLREAMRSARHRIAGTEGDAPRTYSKEMQQAVQSACGRFYNWPLMDGTFLRDATKDKVLKDAETYQKNADANARNARFLRLVAGRLKGGQVVADALTEQQLARLMDRAGKELQAAEAGN